MEKQHETIFIGIIAKNMGYADQSLICKAGKEVFKQASAICDKEHDKGFAQGFAAACAITLQNHDLPSVVEDTFDCNFMTVGQMKKLGVSEHDIEILKPLIREIKRKRNGK